MATSLCLLLLLSHICLLLLLVVVVVPTFAISRALKLDDHDEVSSREGGEPFRHLAAGASLQDDSASEHKTLIKKVAPVSHLMEIIKVIFITWCLNVSGFSSSI
jgi:hypothetical protein